MTVYHCANTFDHALHVSEIGVEAGGSSSVALTSHLILRQPQGRTACHARTVTFPKFQRETKSAPKFSKLDRVVYFYRTKRFLYR